MNEKAPLPQPAAYPRSATYGEAFMLETAMGPNALWLAEAVTAVIGLRPGMRVLDLGCGRASSSIFLAKEFGVSVVAADLWIKPTENGVDGLVMPIAAEAHALPFADGYFDAIVSLDAYHYFGTDDLYAWTIARFLRPGGALGIGVPGVTAELDEPPAHLAPYWDPQFMSFHSPAWWRGHLARSGLFASVEAEAIPDAADHWARWEEFRAAAANHSPGSPRTSSQEAEMLRVDAGRTLLLQRIIARKPE